MKISTLTVKSNFNYVLSQCNKAMILVSQKIKNWNQTTDVYRTSGVHQRISVNSWLLCEVKTCSWWNGVRAVYQTVQMDKIILMAGTTSAQLGLLMLHDLLICSDSWPPACCSVCFTSIYAVLLFALFSRLIHICLIIIPEGSRTPFPLCSLAGPAAPESKSCVRGRRTTWTGFHSFVDICTSCADAKEAPYLFNVSNLSNVRHSGLDG